MKYLLNLMAILLATSGLYSQSVEWGPEYPKPKGLLNTMYNLGHSDEHYYVMTQKGKNQELLRFDYNHNLAGTQRIEAEYNGKKLMVSDLVETSAGHFGLATFYDKKNDQNMAFAFEVLDGGKLDNKPRELFSLPYTRSAVIGIGPLIINANINGDLSGYETSQNDKLVAFTNPFASHDDKKLKDKISLNIFDAHLNEITSSVITFPYSDDDLNLTSFDIMNNGDVYYLGPKWGEKKDREKGIPNFDFHVFRVRGGEIDLEIQVEHEMAGPTQAFVFVDDAGSIYVSGFYTDKNEKYVSDHGTFLAKFDEAGNQEFMIVDEFNSEVKDAFTSEKHQEKGVGIGSLDIDHAVYNKDNQSITFVAEQTYITTSQYMDGNGNWRTRYHYHSNEILVPCYDVGKQELKFLTLVDKSYTTSASAKGSYVYSLDHKTGDIHLLFNDYKSKAERKVMDGSKKSKGRYTDLVSIHSQGDIFYRETLFTSDDTHNDFITRSSVALGDGRMLLFGASKKAYQYGTLRLPR